MNPVGTIAWLPKGVNNRKGGTIILRLVVLDNLIFVFLQRLLWIISVVRCIVFFITYFIPTYINIIVRILAWLTRLGVGYG